MNVTRYHIVFCNNETSIYLQIVSHECNTEVIPMR